MSKKKPFQRNYVFFFSTFLNRIIGIYDNNIWSVDDTKNSFPFDVCLARGLKGILLYLSNIFELTKMKKFPVRKMWERIPDQFHVSIQFCMGWGVNKMHCIINKYLISQFPTSFKLLLNEQVWLKKNHKCVFY